MKVLIVDDEVIIRTGLSTVIRWEEHGFTLLQPAASAEEALEQIAEERPDIIFTDIRMTGKSGLDLASEVKRNYPDTEMIVISGFDEFAYAQQAMREGVSEYLLKTSRPDEIIHAALRAKTKLELRRRTNVVGKTQDRVLSRSLLGRLLASPSCNEETIAEVWSRYPELQITKDKQLLQVCLIKVQDQTSENHRTQEELYAALGERLLESLPCEWLPWNDSMLLLVKIVADHRGWDPVEYGIRKAEKAVGCRTFAAAGLAINDPALLHRSLETAMEASLYEWLLGHQPFVYYEQVEGRKGMRIVSTPEEETELYALLRSGREEDLRTGIEQMLERVKQDSQATPATVQAYLHSLIIAGYRWLDRAASSIGYQVQLPAGVEVEREELARQPEQALHGHLGSVMKQYASMESGMSMIQRAIAYIHEHLDQSLSLHQVARHVHMNPNYFSEVFKRETGQNYIEFVTQVRLRKAMSMLNETPAKISEIAKHIGYGDIKHFNRLFKKFTGQTPSEYRDKS